MIAEDHATLAAYITGVDTAARNAERTWGVNRLPTLVDDELRAKFNRQAAKWDAAITEAYDAKVITRAHLEAAASTSAAMQRAWLALDRDARANDHEPIAPTVWEISLAGGLVGAFVRTAAEAGSVVASGRYAVVWTVDEVGAIIDALPRLLNDAKTVFPGAEVVRKSVDRIDRSWVAGGDEIPF